MSHWNHRIVKQKLADGTDWFSVREVFYNEGGAIFAYSEDPIEIVGESIDELRQSAQWVLDCLDKEILIDGEVTFVDPEDNHPDSMLAFETAEDMSAALDKSIEDSSTDE
jgi:hypothetical protein